jgi:hypothetical protein
MKPSGIARLYFLAVATVGWFSLKWGWIMLALPMVFLAWMVLTHLTQRPRAVDALSAEANVLLCRHFVHYRFPYISVVYAHTAILTWMMCVLLAAIGAFRGHWWGLLWAPIAVMVFARVANYFNPNYGFTRQSERDAHDEILSYLRAESCRQEDALLQRLGIVDDRKTTKREKTAEPCATDNPGDAK